MSTQQLKAPKRNGRVTIIVNAKVKQEGRLIAASPVTERMITALKQAILHNLPQTVVEVVAVATLWSEAAQRQTPIVGQIFCPLTIQLPHWLVFPGQKIYQVCQDIAGYRRWVTTQFGCLSHPQDQGLGDRWLPIIWTAQGPRYGEVIGEGMMPNAYQQPIELEENLRQQLQTLAFNCLEAAQAPPSVYLLQFSLLDKTILFDRLWPFPAAPAIASLGIQEPDLFTCHWLCLNDQPLPDVKILNRQATL